MRLFKIIDNDNIYGFLFYHEMDNKFYIIVNKIDYWDSLMILDHYLASTDCFMNSNQALKWVRTRIIPSDRQNIRSILKDNKLKEYNEFELIIRNKAICPQDEAYIKEIEEDILPLDIKEVLSHRISDFLPISNTKAFVVFYNGIVKIVDMNILLKNHSQYQSILNNEDSIFLWHIDYSGFELSISNVYSIPYHMLYNNGIDIGVSEPELSFFTKRNLVTTGEAIELLECSRQNLDELVKRGRLHPVIDKNKTRLYKKSELMTYINKKA